MTPEGRARINIDNLLEQAGWSLRDAGAVNLHVRNGVEGREFRLKPDYGTVNFLLYVNHNAAGVVEAKPEGSTLTGAEAQFTNRIDPEPLSRRIFSFHTPEILSGPLPSNGPKPSRSSQED